MIVLDFFPTNREFARHFNAVSFLEQRLFHLAGRFHFLWNTGSAARVLPKREIEHGALLSRRIRASTAIAQRLRDGARRSDFEAPYEN